MKNIYQNALLIVGMVTLGSFLSCTTPEAQVETRLEQQVETEIKVNECPPIEPTCPEIFSPTYCAAGAYQGADLPDEEVIRAWGENSCMAKFALSAEACRAGKSPSLLGGVECVPDVSQGKCPALRKICTMDVNPVVCSATRYGSQDLAEKDGISAHGSNECDGRNSLMQQACVKNLDPGKLGGIICNAPK